MSPAITECPSLFAAVTFFARCHPVETCGSNGLPLTPFSIAILGRAQILKTLQHPNLCRYLDIIRGKHERTIIVAQYVGKTLSDFIATNTSGGLDIALVSNIAEQLVDGLSFLHKNGVVHGNLSLDNILIDDENNVKMFNFGLYYMTGEGKFVSFPIGHPKYMAPECILGGPNSASSSPKGDVWSLGLIIAELLLGNALWPALKITQIIRKILSLLQCKNVFERIAREHNCYEKYQGLEADLRMLIESCLSISPRGRPTSEKLLESFRMYNSKNQVNESSAKGLASLPDPLFNCDLKQIYCWWQLAGGDIQAELKRHGLLKNRAPILSLPNLVILNGTTFGVSKDQSSLYDSRVVCIPLTNLISRLKHVKYKDYYPLIHCRKEEIVSGSSDLPLIIRERDTEYQFHRIVLFARLLKGYPYTREMLVEQATIDIPPLLRGEVWACLLGVTSLNEDELYQSIDKETPTATDRQIEVDIPRCHQYNELLSSPVGHNKLKRLLKAWVLQNPQYVYWQGLDSLTAPFLYLNFNNEACAFSSLSRFIPKYLHKFFLKDNSLIIKEYLSKFSQLTAFHEPELAVHLNSIHFIPELFAIPWFLTMFSHVFPLHKILHLWDKLLLGDSSFPLYIGLSILKQLKSTLLNSGFNECILLFSDLPDVDIETCVLDSMQMYLNTPRSILYRQHEIKQDGGNEFDISGIELNILQNEFCPRISTNDVLNLLKNTPDKLTIVDLRSSIQYNRVCLEGSINIPFASVQLGVKDLSALGQAGAALEQQIPCRNVVVVSPEPNNAELFSRFLVECSVERVCMLHGGFNILYSVTPNILHSNN